jgi:hypothetical protein
MTFTDTPQAHKMAQYNLPVPVGCEGADCHPTDEGEGG